MTPRKGHEKKKKKYIIIIYKKRKEKERKADCTPGSLPGLRKFA